MLKPVLEQVASELQDKVKITKLDIDKNHVTAKTHHVTSVPTLILFKDGKKMKICKINGYSINARKARLFLGKHRVLIIASMLVTILILGILWP